MLAFKVLAQNASLSEIDQTVDQIKNNIDNFEKLEKLNSEEGFRNCYFKDGQLQIIEVHESGKVEKNVIWIYSKNFLIYTETNWQDSMSGRKLYSEKTYHNKANMIAWLNSESTFVDSSSPEFKKMDRELKAYSIKIHDEAKE